MKGKVSVLIPHQIPHDHCNLNEESPGGQRFPTGWNGARNKEIKTGTLKEKKKKGTEEGANSVARLWGKCLG